MSNNKVEISRGDADELAIRNLIAQIAHLSDNGSLDDYIQCFTADAVWGGGGQPYREGRDEILAGARDRREKGLTGPGSNALHVTATSWIELEGDSATAHTVFHFYTDTHAEPRLRAMGLYEDLFVRQGAVWKLKRRELSGAAKDLPVEK
jgi:ketosteroid isomerase-like protein